MNKLIKQRNQCVACGGNKLVEVLSLGKTPPANAFLKNRDKRTINKEHWFPLSVDFCKRCAMVQLKEIVNPKLLFENYVYASSTSTVFMDHFKYLAKKLKFEYRLEKHDLIIDIGSNDGIFLKPIKKLGVRVLGVEPAKNIAKLAISQGVPTLSEFFDIKTAIKILNRYGKAKIITATNVFAHVANIEEVVNGVKILLEDDGVFVIEVAYLLDLIKKNLFDTIYHEHLYYWTVYSLRTFIKRHQMEIVAVEKIPTHGGSIRVFIEKFHDQIKIQPSVSRFIVQEKKLGLMDEKTYVDFSARIVKNKRQLRKFLIKLKSQGKRIIGFGAPAKGNTLLNYFGITNNILDYIVDDSPFKQKLYTPGTHIPIAATNRMYADKPEYILILAWNFAKQILTTHRNVKRWNGKFIVPVPNLKVIN